MATRWGGRRKRPPQQPVGPERGMVTAELAMGVLLSGLLLWAVVWGIGAGYTQLHVNEVASQVARQEARGAHDVVQRLSAEYQELDIRVDREQGRALVQVVGHSPALGVLPSLELRSTATVALEPGESNS